MNKLIEPPFNYTGSKFKLLPQLLPLFDTTCRRFVDVFAGGGSVYANVAPLFQGVLANDIIYHLIDVQRNLVADPAKTIAATQALAVAKDDQEAYHKLRDDFNQTPTPEKLWALMCCCTNNMMRFNRKWQFNQTFGKRTFNPKTLAKAQAFAAHLQPYADRIQWTSSDFEKVPVQDGDMVYIDPPYSNTEAGYNAYWNKDDDLRLFNWITSIVSRGAKVAVSGVKTHNGETCRLLELLAASFNLVPIIGDYNKVSRTGDKVTQEVAMLSYTPATITQPKPQAHAAANLVTA